MYTASKRKADERKDIRIYTWAIVLPPALATWVVAAAFLPEWWTPEIFQAAHGTQHELHLLGDLTAKVEPTLAYMMLTFAAGAALFAVVGKVMCALAR